MSYSQNHRHYKLDWRRYYVKECRSRAESDVIISIRSPPAAGDTPSKEGGASDDEIQEE